MADKTDNIKTKLSFDGEAQYKAACKEINSTLKLLNSEGMDIQTKTDIIHQKIYDFLLYIYPLLTKYPKYEKFSLQTATRNAILEMLQEAIKWDKTATKSHLYTVDTALQESKELLRLAHDLKYSASLLSMSWA